MARVQVAQIHEFNPLEDLRWKTLVERHPDASIFHTNSWVEALHRTYGYEAVVFTTCAPSAPLTNGILFSRVESWLTGSRLVSVPFADHCDPLLRDDELVIVLRQIEQNFSQYDARYFELRPLLGTISILSQHPTLSKCASYTIHRLDLRPPVERLFGRFHPSCIQRKIRRAQREGITTKYGNSDDLLHDFYVLLKMTRRRHGLPPQPRAWFCNLRDSFGENLNVRVAYSAALPVAAVLTIAHRTVMVYKYGCSDERFHRLGAMPLLFWQTIQEAKSAGMETLDLGRADNHQQGLIDFKDHLGAISSALSYYKYPSSAVRNSKNRFSTTAITSRLPQPLLTAAGELLYKHMG